MTTTTSATLLSLADRVEAGSGVDRALDAEIACAVVHRNLRPAAPDDFDGKFGYSPGHVTVATGFLQSLPYTRSFDAAMTLVPADPWLEIKGPRKYLNIPTPVPNVWSAIVSRWNHEGQGTGWGDTPARALTAACLRARAMEADNA